MFSDCNLVRILEFVSEYKVKCSLIADKITETTLKTTATGHLYQMIKQFCQQGTVLVCFP